MFFIPKMHDSHPAFLILGAILIVGFVFFKGLSDHPKTVVIATIVVMTSLLLQFFIELFGDMYTFFKYEELHFIVHFIFGTTYFVFALGLYYEYSQYNKNQKIQRATFDYNEAILFEYNKKKNLIQIEISKRLSTLFKVGCSSLKTNVEEFLSWVDEKDRLKLKCFVEDNVDVDNTIFHIRFNGNSDLVAIQIKGSYNLHNRKICLGFNYTLFETLELKSKHQTDIYLNLLKNLKVGVLEIKPIYEDHLMIDYEYLYVNDAFEEMTGISHDFMYSHTASEIIPHQYEERLSIYSDVLTNQKTVSLESILETDNKYYSLTVYPSSNDNIVIIYQNIDDLKRANNELEYLTAFNRTNGLLNYIGMEREIDKIKPNLKSAICFYAKVDNFDDIETFYGSKFSEQLIKQIAEQFKYYVDSKDIVANTKFFHFILILINPSKSKIDKTLKHAKESIYRKHTIDGRDVYVKQDIGYAVLNEDTKDIYELITMAQIASKQVSVINRNVVMKYQSDYTKQIDTNMNIASRLNYAIENSKIDVYFQKIVNVNTNKVVYIEALARWIDEELGFVPPDVFIELAEKSSVIEMLDDYLVDLSLRKFKTLQGDKINKAKLSLNISPSAVYRDHYDANLFEKTLSHGLNPNDIVIEISENTFVRETDKCVMMIQKLKAYGFLVAIDDFGSKYSSFSILDIIPYDILKLDGIFASKIEQDSTKMLIKTLTEMCHKDNRLIVVEKIENEDVKNEFVKLGCVIHQGYYYHKPERLI